MRLRYVVVMVLLVGTGACGQSSSPTSPTGSTMSSCSYAVSPQTQAAPADGGTFTATMVTTAACQWTAAADVPWIAVASGSSGMGTGTITYAVQPNPDVIREGTVTARPNGGASVTVTVIQAGVAE